MDSVGIGMIGLGTVGQGVATLLRDMADEYAARAGRRVELRRVLVRDEAKAAATGLIDPDRITDQPDALLDDPAVDAVVEVAGGLDPVGGYVERALASGRSVVTANKALLADRGPVLLAVARRAGVALAFEASCAGAVPCINAMLYGLMANRFDGMYGILNGTCNYMLTEMADRGMGYAEALDRAQRLGYAEADPTMDVSGRDAAQKLAILAMLAFGRVVSESQLRVEGIDRLRSADIRAAADLGYAVRLLAIAERDISQAPDDPRYALAVEPCFVPGDHVLASVRGPFNAVFLDGHASGPVMLYGQGAGRMPTASAVVSDLLHVVGGGVASFTHSGLVPHLGEDSPRARVEPAEELRSRFYLRLSAMDRPGTVGRVATVLGEAGISISAIEQREARAGEFVPLSLILHRCPRGWVHRAVEHLAELDVVDGEPVVIRIADLDRQPE